MEVTKLVEGCFISNLALVSSPEVACGFRYDSNHRDWKNVGGKSKDFLFSGGGDSERGGLDNLSDVVEEDGMEDEEEDEMDEIETGSDCRTHDEQMDYLESLEHCPCYAKCICDSIITLFCVTLLG